MDNKSNLNAAAYGIINDRIRSALDSYYKNRDADSFFKLVEYMNSVKSLGIEKEIPCFIELQNVIVMG